MCIRDRGSGASTCPTCNGRGEVLYQQSFLSIRRTCSTCGGSGKVIRHPCTECRGHGYRQVQRELKVNIPAEWTMACACASPAKDSPAAMAALPETFMSS